MKSLACSGSKRLFQQSHCSGLEERFRTSWSSSIDFGEKAKAIIAQSLQEEVGNGKHHGHESGVAKHKEMRWMTSIKPPPLHGEGPVFGRLVGGRAAASSSSRSSIRTAPASLSELSSVDERSLNVIQLHRHQKFVAHLA
mmetsp:Transcript_37237/g.58844  ORF Transcript_37237/g.58844 Transcript_37237/m.58844 type:complete len:140 (+) Transcript_37237:179-598(+)